MMLAIVAAGAWFDWKDQYDALDAAKNDETKLREQYAQKKVKAINFELYVQQLKEVEQSFGALVKQLPNRAEIDALLTDINQAGLGRGLSFELFRPAPQERMADFYAELPIAIRITGNYHDMRSTRAVASRPKSWARTSGRLASARSSTSATRSATRSRPSRATAGGSTVKPSPPGWCSRRGCRSAFAVFRRRTRDGCAS